MTEAATKAPMVPAPDKREGVATPAPSVLTVEGLQAYYRFNRFGLRREVRAVDGVSFEIARNEIYGLAGESSCGKTTLVKAIAGLVRPPLEILDGTIRFAFLPERDGIHLASPWEIERIRWRHLSYIMQGSMSVLNPLRRVGRIFADFAFRHLGLTRDAFAAAVETQLQRVKLDRSVLAAYPHELSGGMRQRVVIALATICRPEFIIADEPTTALDVIVQKEVLDMLRALQREMGSSILFVTHDMGVHAHLTDRLGIMYAGRLVEEGPTSAIFAQPRHPYTRYLVGSLPRIGDERERSGLEGNPPNLADPPAGCRFHPRCPLAMAQCRSSVPPLIADAGGHRVACFAVNDGSAVA